MIARSLALIDIKFVAAALREEFAGKTTLMVRDLGQGGKHRAVSLVETRPSVRISYEPLPGSGAVFFLEDQHDCWRGNLSDVTVRLTLPEQAPTAQRGPNHPRRVCGTKIIGFRQHPCPAFSWSTNAIEAPGS